MPDGSLRAACDFVSCQAQPDLRLLLPNQDLPLSFPALRKEKPLSATLDDRGYRNQSNASDNADATEAFLQRAAPRASQ